MRIPWRATLDVLIDELCRHLVHPPTEDDLEDIRISRIVEKEIQRKTSVGRQIGKSPSSSDLMTKERAQELVAPNPDNAMRIREALVLLNEVRALLPSRSPREQDLRLSVREIRELTGSLDSLDESLVRYPDQEGREGLARFVEKGGLFGSIVGKHVASALRGEPVFLHSSGNTFEEGRYRRFAVKRVATIQHLYGVGRVKGVRMFCELEDVNDPNEKADDRIMSWLKKDQKLARKYLKDRNLPERDARHYKAVIDGLRPDLPRGFLKDRDFPQAFLKCIELRQ